MALRGELDISGSADAASAIAALTARERVVVVDLSALDFMDCASLGALLRVRALARQAASDIRLAGLQPMVRRLLALTGADDVFSVYASVDAAVASIGSLPKRHVSQRPAASVACSGRTPLLRDGSGW